MNITSYIMGVYNDFVEYINEGEKLCKLLNLRFNNGNIPDYDNVRLQEYYLLRFAYTYEFSYETMFESLLKLFPKIKEQASTVLSIGCGAGLDAMGFYTKYGVQNINKLKYIGIDIVDWSHKYTNSNTIYIQQDICEWLNSKDKTNIDIVSFPKSISEFSTSEIIKIAKRIGQINQSNDMYILVSLRTDTYNLNNDIDSSETFINELINAGYNRVGGNKPEHYIKFKEPDSGVYNYNGGNGYPEEAKELCSTLGELCSTNNDCDQCNPTVLNRWPQMKVGNIFYQLVHLERE